MRFLNARILIFLALTLFPVGLGTISASPTPFDSYPANVNGLTLDRTVLRGKDQSRLVKVWTLAADPEGDVLRFNFTVSGGKILNAKLYPGKEFQTFAISGDLLEESRYEVVWDLTEVEPGEYSITAGVDDGCGLCGQTKTQTVLVDPSSNDGISTCPSKFEVVWSKTYGTRRQPVRFLAVPVMGQLYETLPPARWTFTSNAIVGGNGSPLVDIVSNRKQQYITGSFVRDPNYVSPTCDFSGDFRLELFQVHRR